MIILNDLDISSLLKAAKKFDEILTYEKNEIIRDAAIQRFEFTFELVWKTLRKILIKRGVEANSPKTVFRFAYKDSLITDPNTWFEFIDFRNITSHVYNETIADEIFINLPRFQILTNTLIAKLNTAEFK